MSLKRVLFHTTFLSGLALAATTALAADILVNNGEAPVITTTQNVDNAWVGLSNPDQYLEVEGDDGWIISTSAAIGLDATSDGNNVIVRNGGRWDQTGSFIVGNRGSENSLLIEEGGEVTATSAIIGLFEGADSNQIVIDGIGSSLDVSGDLTVGFDTLYNNLNVINGGTTDNTLAFIGRNAGSGNNVVTVRGAGSAWVTELDGADTGILHLGFSGSNNEMNVLEGGTVVVEDQMLLGTNAGSDGNELLISGAGSLVDVGTTLYVGRSGHDNSIVIENGGTLDTGAARIGGGSNAEAVSGRNTVTVRGAGSAWTNNGSLRIGDGSTRTSSDNKLIVENGGSVSLTTGAATFIGREAADSGNQLVVRGAGSSFSTTGDIDVGKQSDSIASILLIDDGGTVSAGGVGVGNKSGLALGNGASLAATGLSLTDGSAVVVAIDDARPSSIDVSGIALLNGTLVASISPDGLTRNRYEVLSAGTVAGTFDTLVLDGTRPNFTASLDYTANDVWLDFIAQLGAAEALDRNQSNVAGALDDYFNGGGAVTGPIASLYGLTGGALETALTEVSGEVGASGGVNAIERATTSFLNLLVGGGGQSAAPTGGRQAAAAINTGIVPTADAPPASGGWSLWGGVYGGVADISGSSSKGSHDTDTNVGGIATGWDYDVAPDTRVGLAIAGGQTNWDLDSNLGSGDSTFFQLGGYGTQHFGATYLSLAAAYAWHSMSTDRRVNVDGTEKLDADFDASNLAGRIEAGHRFAASQQLGVTPYAAFQAQAVYMPGYNEDGGAFALDYDAETATALRSELGIGLDMGLGADPSVARIFGRAAWAHDWNSDASVQASFASLDMSTFTVNGAEMPDNIALLTAGAEFGLSEATELAATFDGEFGDGYQSYAGSVTLTYSW